MNSLQHVLSGEPPHVTPANSQETQPYQWRLYTLFSTSCQVSCLIGLQRTHREHSLVNGILEFPAVEDHTPTRPTQALMCGGGHDVGVLERAGHGTTSHQTYKRRGMMRSSWDLKRDTCVWWS
jgi:hypothetical protein